MKTNISDENKDDCQEVADRHYDRTPDPKQYLKFKSS